MVLWQTWWAGIYRVEYCLGGKYIRRNFLDCNNPGGNFLGGNFPGRNFPGGSYPGWEFSRWGFSRWELSWVGIFFGGGFSDGNCAGGNHPGGSFPGTKRIPSCDFWAYEKGQSARIYKRGFIDKNDHVISWNKYFFHK